MKNKDIMNEIGRLGKNIPKLTDKQKDELIKAIDEKMPETLGVLKSQEEKDKIIENSDGVTGSDRIN